MTNEEVTKDLAKMKHRELENFVLYLMGQLATHTGRSTWSVNAVYKDCRYMFDEEIAKMTKEIEAELENENQ